MPWEYSSKNVIENVLIPNTETPGASIIKQIHKEVIDERLSAALDEISDTVHLFTVVPKLFNVHISKYIINKFSIKRARVKNAVKNYLKL